MFDAIMAQSENKTPFEFINKAWRSEKQFKAEISKFKARAGMYSGDFVKAVEGIFDNDSAMLATIGEAAKSQGISRDELKSAIAGHFAHGIMDHVIYSAHADNMRNKDAHAMKFLNDFMKADFSGDDVQKILQKSGYSQREAKDLKSFYLKIRKDKSFSFSFQEMFTDARHIVDRFLSDEKAEAHKAVEELKHRLGGEDAYNNFMGRVLPAAGKVMGRFAENGAMASAFVSKLQEVSGVYANNMGNAAKGAGLETDTSELREFIKRLELIIERQQTNISQLEVEMRRLTGVTESVGQSIQAIESRLLGIEKIAESGKKAPRRKTQEESERDSDAISNVYEEIKAASSNKSGDSKKTSAVTKEPEGTKDDPFEEDLTGARGLNL